RRCRPSRVAHPFGAAPRRARWTADRLRSASDLGASHHVGSPVPNEVMGEPGRGVLASQEAGSVLSALHGALTYDFASGVQIRARAIHDIERSVVADP